MTREVVVIGRVVGPGGWGGWFWFFVADYFELNTEI